MDLIDRHRKYYGIPSKLDASAPEYDIKYSVGHKYETECWCRQQRVFPTPFKNQDSHVLCVLMDHTKQYINPANLEYRKAT